MINIAHFTHAYRQAPWRIQRQWMGTFLLGLLALAMVSALYLDVTAQTAITGREIQNLKLEITSLNSANADLQSQLAELLSTAVMEARAFELGFRPAEAGEIHYLIVPGFTRSSGVSLAADRPQASGSGIPPEYTQSLLEWAAEYLSDSNTGIAGTGAMP